MNIIEFYFNEIIFINKIVCRIMRNWHVCAAIVRDSSMRSIFVGIIAAKLRRMDAPEIH